MNMIKLNNTAIKKDSSNQYCLNDLHKAAMKQGKANNQQRPSSFLRNETIITETSITLDGKVGSPSYLFKFSSVTAM